jgi:hypothetical protein
MINYQFKDLEFRNMKFSPSRIHEGKSVFDVYPELKEYPEFLASCGRELDNNLVMLYIFCMYDKGTPYLIKYPDVIKRKIEIAGDLGFKKSDKGVFDDPVDKMLKGKNSRVQRKIVTFIRMMNDYEWAYHITLAENYYNLTHSILSGKNTNINNLQKMKEQLEVSLAKMTNRDDTKQLESDVLKYIEEDRLKIRAEDFAEMLADGKNPFDEDEIFEEEDKKFAQ